MNRYSLNHKCLTGYTRWLLLLTALSLSAGCESNKFLIKTEQAQQDFVILCQWWTDPILMGGKNLTYQKEIVSDSNKVGSCGDFPLGDFYIRVLHPLYRRVNSCGEPSLCELDKNGVMVFTPVPFDEYLRTLQENSEGDEIYDWVRSAAIRQFDSHYFQYYKEARKFDLNQFKSRYQDRLKEILQLTNTIRDPNAQIDPEEYMEIYWERAKKALSK
jgi:hypothetical protein